MSFGEDRLFGEAAESEVAKILERIHSSQAVISSGNRPEWDIMVGGAGYEVKADRLADRTGNIFIETHNPYTGVRKGIYASEAQYLVYCTKTRMMCFSIRDLKRHIKESDSRGGVKSYTGNASGILLKIKDVEHLITWYEPRK
jgi:hypothetical protein